VVIAVANDSVDDVSELGSVVVDSVVNSASVVDES
jgi:hypothetical protein